MRLVGKVAMLLMIIVIYDYVFNLVFGIFDLGDYDWVVAFVSFAFGYHVMGNIFYVYSDYDVRFTPRHLFTLLIILPFYGVFLKRR